MKRTLLVSNILLFFSFSLFSQSLVLTDIDSEEYPRFDAEFYYINEDNRKAAIDQNNLSLFENDIQMDFSSYECTSNDSTYPISSVLVIDNSGSMYPDEEDPNNKRHIHAKEAAKLWVDMLNNGSETAVTTFAAYADIIYPLSSDYESVKSSINNIELGVETATYYEEAFLNENGGAFKALEDANNQKIVVLLTDGDDSGWDNEEVIKKALEENVKVYCIGFHLELNAAIKEVAKISGGYWFDEVKDPKNLKDIYRAILLHSIGYEPCKFAYFSENCDKERNVELKYKELSDNRNVVIDQDNLTSYKLSSNEIQFGYKNSDESYAYLIISSQSDILEIENIEISNENFEIIKPEKSDFPIELTKDEKLIVEIKQADIDDKSASDILNIRSNSCSDYSVRLNSFDQKNDNILKVIYPNGGELLYANSQAEYHWENPNPDLRVTVEFTSDAGFTWDTLSTNNTDTQLNINKLPNIDSDRCLLRVSNSVESGYNFETQQLIVEKENRNIENIDTVVRVNDNLLMVVDVGDSLKLKGETLINQDYPDDDYKKFIVLLDKNLNVLKYNEFPSSSLSKTFLFNNDEGYFLIRSIDDHDINNFYISKFDEDLNEIDNQTIENNSSFSSELLSADYRNGKLAIIGKGNNEIIVDKDTIVTDRTANIYFNFLLEFDDNLDLTHSKVFSSEEEFEFETRKVKILDDDKYLITGKTIYWKEHDFYKDKIGIVNFEYSKSSGEIEQKPSLFANKSFNISYLDHLKYSNNYYFLTQMNADIIDSSGNELIDVDIANVVLLALNESSELLWSHKLDRYNKSKKLLLTDNKELLVSGFTSERIIIDTFIVHRSENHFNISLSPEGGNFLWGNVVNPISNIICKNINNNYYTFGIVHGEADFGNGFEHIPDSNGSKIDLKNFIWQYEVSNKNFYDVSDSLWSIKKPGFTFPDTLDLKEAFVNTTKDSLVENFITVEDDIEFEINDVTIMNPIFRVTNSFPMNVESIADMEFLFSPIFLGEANSDALLSTSLGDYKFAIRGIGIEPEFEILHRDTILDFGEVEIPQEKTLGLEVIRNLSDDYDIAIDSVIISGQDIEEFSYEIISNDQFILPEEILEMEFTFAPTTVGEKNSTANIYINAADEPIKVFLRGDAVTPDSVVAVFRIDEHKAETDQFVNIPVYIEDLVIPEEFKIGKIEVQFRFNPTLIIPYNFDDEGFVEESYRYITVEFANGELTKNSMKDLRYFTTLGNSIDTDLEFVDAKAFDESGDEIDKFHKIFDHGYLELTNVCFTNGEYRLIESSRNLGLSAEIDNETLHLNYSLTEKGLTELSIFDINGILAVPVLNKNLDSGEYKTEVNIDNIAQGVYIIRLETPTQIISKTIPIVK